jgi:hypothetical protein
VELKQNGNTLAIRGSVATDVGFLTFIKEKAILKV